MTYERFYGPHEQFFGWRCVYCGEIVDEVILENRQWLRKEIVLVNKRRVFSGSKLYNSRFDLDIENNRSEKEE
jgi:hypothetical protein